MLSACGATDDLPQRCVVHPSGHWTNCIVFFRSGAGPVRVPGGLCSPASCIHLRVAVRTVCPCPIGFDCTLTYPVVVVVVVLFRSSFQFHGSIIESRPLKPSNGPTQSPKSRLSENSDWRYCQKISGPKGRPLRPVSVSASRTASVGAGLSFRPAASQ